MAQDTGRRPRLRQLYLGRIAGVPVRVSPTWFLVAAVITVGFEPLVRRYLPDLGPRAYLVTAAFAVLLYVSVLFHEISHALTARAFGLRVHGITVHFLGGYTEIERESPTPGRDLAVAAAGPAVSVLIGVVAYLASIPVDGAVAEFLLFELAAANVVVGAFNLLPALPLDGGHMLRSVVWRISGNETMGTIVAARAGQVLAVLAIAAPFLLAGGRPGVVSVVWAALVAALLWSGASQALTVAALRAKLPGLDAHRLARQAWLVPADLPVSQALEQAATAGATALVVVDAAGRATGVVTEAAVAATPLERRPWVAVGDFARSVRPELVLSAELTAERLLAAMRAAPASEYLVVDSSGRLVGVLSAADVDAALTTR